MVQTHPSWCSPINCTAYDNEYTDHRCHRSDPVVLPTTDHHIKIYVYRSAENASDNRIELIELEEPITTPWYLNEPRDKHVAEMAMSLEMAHRMQSAITALIEPNRSRVAPEARRTRRVLRRRPPPESTPRGRSGRRAT